jgi:hypothetical protein
MARVFAAAAVAAFLTLCVAGCAAAAPQANAAVIGRVSAVVRRLRARQRRRHLLDVIDHPAFEGFGRFLFLTGRGLPPGGKTLRDAAGLLPYHRHVDVTTTVDVGSAGARMAAYLGSRGSSAFGEMICPVRSRDHGVHRAHRLHQAGPADLCLRR